MFLGTVWCLRRYHETSQILIPKHSWALRIAADTDLALAMAFALMGLQTSLENRNLGRAR